MKIWIAPAVVSALMVGWVASVRAIAGIGAGAAKGISNGSKLRTGGATKTASSSSTAQGRRRSEPWKLGADGSVKRTLVSGRGRHTETGVWWLNKKGKVCVRWPNQTRKHCGFLASTDNGGYELDSHKNKAEKFPAAPTKVKK